MHTTLYCFVGDDHCRFVAQKLTEIFPDSEILPIPTQGTITVSDHTGLIVPVVDGYPPKEVTDFIRNDLPSIDLSPMHYLFCIHVSAKHSYYAPLMVELSLQEIGCLSSYQNTIKATTEAALTDKLSSIAQDIKDEKIRVSVKLPFAKLKVRHLMGISQKLHQESSDEERSNQ